MRKALRRSRSGIDSMSARFQAFATGDYQFQVQGLVRVCSRVGMRTRDLSRVLTLNKIKRLLSKWLFSKAFRLVDTNDLADMSTPHVISQAT